jgi:myo-inositol-1(or 4)-monophosphatase
MCWLCQAGRMASHDELLTLALGIAREAGALALRRRSEGVEVAATKSTPTDIVTLADRETEALIRARLADARPADGFFGEESDATTGSSGLTWVVDPIDGTVNYAYGIPSWAVSIAVVEGEPDPATWRTLAGAVVNPTIGEEFTAVEGGGSYLNGRALQVATGLPLSLALVGTGFSYDADRRTRAAQILEVLISQIRDVRRIGAASLDLCSVAAGRLDAYYERGLQPWDHAAGALIAREAGAQVGGIDGAAAGRALTIAAEPGLYAQLAPLLSSLGITDD